MEDNKNLSIITPAKKKKKINISLFIEKISKTLSIDKKIKITGKTLHYLSNLSKEKMKILKIILILHFASIKKQKLIHLHQML